MSAPSSSRICDNCGQPVLRSDVECWHCGVRLSPLESNVPAAELEHGGAPTAASQTPTAQLLFYALMTVATALALLLVIRALGRQPRLAVNFASAGETAVELAAPDGSFSIEVPEDLVWYFPQANWGRDTSAPRLREDKRFDAALLPLSSLAPDREMVLIGRWGDAFLTIARSDQLGTLMIDQVVRSLSSETYPGSIVLSTDKGSTRSGSQTAMITVDQMDLSLICRQQLLPHAGEAYLTAICIDQAEFERRTAVFEAVLDSLNIR